MNTQSTRQRLIPLFLWIIFGAWIFFALQQSDFFYTSIGWVPITTDLSMSDVVISENKTGEIIFTAMKAIPDVMSVSLVVSYDPENIALEASSFRSQYGIDAIRANEGQFLITLQDVGTVNEKTTLLTIDAQQKSDFLTLSDVIAHFADYSTPLIISQVQ